MEASGVPAYIFMLGTLTLPENVEEKLHGGGHKCGVQRQNAVTAELMNHRLVPCLLFSLSKLGRSSASYFLVKAVLRSFEGNEDVTEQNVTWNSLPLTGLISDENIENSGGGRRKK